MKKFVLALMAIAGVGLMADSAMAAGTEPGWWDPTEQNHNGVLVVQAAFLPGNHTYVLHGCGYTSNGGGTCNTSNATPFVQYSSWFGWYFSNVTLNIGCGAVRYVEWLEDVTTGDTVTINTSQGAGDTYAVSPGC